MSPRVYQIPEKQPVTVPSRSKGLWLIAPHWPFDAAKTKAAKAELLRRGHCLIRAVWGGDDELAEWYAIEGSHRIWLCSQHGIPVTIQGVGLRYWIQHDNPELGIVRAAEILSVREDIRGPEARYAMRRVP